MDKTGNPQCFVLFQFMALFFLNQFYNTFGSSFLVPRFIALGLSYSSIGLITSLGFLSSIISQVGIGYLINKYNRIKQIYLLFMAVLTVLISLVYLPGASYFPISVFMGFQVFISLCIHTMMGLLDTWAMGTSPELQQKYGLVRAHSSFGWVVSGLILAYFVSKHGFPALAVGAWIMLPILFFLVKFIPNGRAADVHIRFSDMKGLFKDKPYACTVLIFFLCFILVTSEITLATMKLSSFGRGNNFGYFYSALGIAEIPLMLGFHHLVKRIPVSYFIPMGILGYACRLFLFSRAESVQEMLLVGLFMGSFSFSPIQMSSRHMLKKITPFKFYNLGMMTGIALTWGLTGVISALLTGLLAQYVGIANTYRLYMGYSAIIFAAAIIFAIHYKGWTGVRSLQR